MHPPNDTIHREDQLYRLWEERAIAGASWNCRGGERVVVISRGRRNDLAGPDYRGAVLLLDGLVTSGDIEMHLRESEWFVHRHQLDSEYAGVILHVVASPAGEAQLAIPTVLAENLPVGDQQGERGMAAQDFGIDSLAELSWGRLLRRVTEIVRDGQEWPLPDRMRRAFLGKLYDVLGYSANRLPMARLAEALLEREPELRDLNFDATARMIFGLAGVRTENLFEIGRGFMSNSRLDAILAPGISPPLEPGWRFDTRPANSPERRLWGAAKLTFDLYHNDLLRDLLRSLLAGSVYGRGMAKLMPRFGGETFIGSERAREIIVNGLLPVALVAGLVSEHRPLTEAACLAYRNAPSLGSNRIVRQVEDRYLGSARLQGAFWQQGAIELYQRYLRPDRRGISMVAETSAPAA
jgi:hypothetical protein